MSLKCLIGLHEWNGCKCSACGKARDAQHDWSKDCEECARCGKRSEHKWDGCTCTVCRKTRDEGHKWDGCRCTTCSETRDEGHTFADSTSCACSRCGKRRHEREGCKCRRCGMSWHDFSQGVKCSRCNDMNQAKCRGCGHIWTGPAIDRELENRQQKRRQSSPLGLFANGDMLVGGEEGRERCEFRCDCGTFVYYGELVLTYYR